MRTTSATKASNETSFFSAASPPLVEDREEERRYSLKSPPQIEPTAPAGASAVTAAAALTASPAFLKLIEENKSLKAEVGKMENILKEQKHIDNSYSG